MKIISLIRTCIACPSQWDGATDDDRAVYVRFRWGHLAVSVGEVGDKSEYAAVGGRHVLDMDVGDSPFGGDMADEQLTEILKANDLIAEDCKREGEITAEELNENMEGAAEFLTSLIENGTVQVVDDPAINAVYEATGMGKRK